MGPLLQMERGRGGKSGWGDLGMVVFIVIGVTSFGWLDRDCSLSRNYIGPSFDLNFQKARKEAKGREGFR